MNHPRRRLLALLWLAASAGPARAANLHRVAVSVPGPGNLLFLPVTLAQKLGFDKAEGIELDIRYVGGGPQAFQEMLERNTDFSAGGFAALGLQRASGKPVVCIAPISRVPAYTLLVRKQLERQVRSVKDLSGMVLGVKGHVPGGRSTTQLFVEYVLRQAGVAVDRVNFVAVGQAYDSQHAALASGTVDAIMGDEPFATRLVGEKVAFVLADFHDLAATRKLLGGLFLNGHLATREDFIASRPDTVARMVATLTRTLVWIAAHTAREVVEALQVEDAEARAALLSVLGQHKDIYCPDGKFSQEQVATANRFLHAADRSEAVQALQLGSIVNSQWAGSAP
ncbi:ABC transporter substrate-binding protein [Rhodoferax lacus]|nr:ABC transporter substrate-binding protein [Rhodoferax lacus]